MERSLVLILDFGAQYTQLIARRIREQHVYCEIHPCTLPFEKVRELAPKGIVLSGGPASTLETGSPTVDARVFELGVPVLGICYGMQLMCRLLGGKVEKAQNREYGPAVLSVQHAVGVFKAFKPQDKTNVLMSHGDRVIALPSGFTTLATSEGSPFAAVGHADKRLYGVQFHPEVAHTDRGEDMLSSFLFDVCGLTPDWTSRSFIDETVSAVRERVGSGRAVCALSGGVDSSVAALLVSKAIGDRLTCIFVDNGVLRKDEAAQVVQMVQHHLNVNLVHVDAAERFLAALAGVTDPETKQDHRPAVHRDLRRGSQEARQGRLSRAGHPVSRRDRERVVQGAERGDQDAP